MVKQGFKIVDHLRGGGQLGLRIEDVREFIKKTKVMINDYWTNGVGQCICPECFEKRESDEDRVEDCMFLKMFEEIDKLAGKDLIKWENIK